MHDEAMQYVTKAVEGLTPGSVLDLGGRNVNGTPRHLFPDTRYVSVDIRPGNCVDIVSDCADLYLDETFDLVVSTELLEHTRRACEIVATASRHLNPGGMFVATMAGPGRGAHGASGEPQPPPGEFYRNVEPADLERWLEAAGFNSWDIDQSGHDLRCTASREVT